MSAYLTLGERFEETSFRFLTGRNRICGTSCEYPAAGRRLSYDDIFVLFGLGWHAEFPALYRDSLRDELSAFARAYWDRRMNWFASFKGNFYTRGLTGLVMRSLQWRLHARRRGFLWIGRPGREVRVA